MSIRVYRRIAFLGLLSCCVAIVWVAIFISQTTNTGPPWLSQSRDKPLAVHERRGSRQTINVHSEVVMSGKSQIIHGPSTKQMTKNVTTLHVHSGKVRIWPDPEFPGDDRILAQMEYSLETADPGEVPRDKVILIYRTYGSLAREFDTQTYADLKCRVSRCSIVTNKDKFDTADVVLFDTVDSPPTRARPARQIWMMYVLEPPTYSTRFSIFKNMLNWTASYRADSTIVTPYEKFVPYTPPAKKVPMKNYAAGKTKQVAWFVSNCNSMNNRLDVAKELGRYITVDIFGTCGDKSCPRRKQADCFQMLNNDYKFYLSFENSNCAHYISEKLFRNGLQNDVIPIVMGARPEDYKRVAPPHSYIHLENFDTVEELAKYLHILNLNDDLYNEYFLWKGTGQFVNTQFWCRLCALAHDTENRPPSNYPDILEWWYGEGTCIGSKRWTDYYKLTRQGRSPA